MGTHSNDSVPGLLPSLLSAASSAAVALVQVLGHTHAHAFGFGFGESVRGTAIQGFCRQVFLTIPASRGSCVSMQVGLMRALSQRNISSF